MKYRAHLGALVCFCVQFALAFLTTLAPAQNRFVQVPSFPAGGSLPTLLAQHDVNGDGKLDLIVLNVNKTAKTETVSLLLGTGTGGYEAPKTMATYPWSYGVPLAGDVNRDGHLDLIFSVSGTSPQTRVYLGTGETFETTAKVSTGVNCAALAPIGCEMQLADVNKDGNPDLIENGTKGVAVMLGEGTGSFKAPVYAPGVGPFAIGDFNNDGIPDLAVLGSILFGNGNGTFRQGPGYSTGPYYYPGDFGAPVAADLRGNGDTDLILPLTNYAAVGDSYQNPFGGILVMLGNGNGTFASNSVSYYTGEFTYGVTVADINGDGRPDIVVANQEASSYSVLLNEGGGKFGTPMNYMTPQGVASNFLLGDLTNNGKLDLSVSSQSGVDVFLSEADGKLRAPGALEIDGAPGQTWAADVNRDGIPDLIANFSPIYCGPCESGGALVLVSENGVPFATGGNINTAPGYLNGISGGGDFNGDGYPDLLISSWENVNFLYVAFNNHQGSFPTAGPGQGYPYGGGSNNAVGDFNRDGLADVAEAFYDSGFIQIALGDGKGNLNDGASYTLGFTPDGLLARDINGDGKLDLIATGGDEIAVLLGNGDGTFQPAKTYTVDNAIGYTDFADFNRDGHVDIVVGGGSEVSVLLNNGNGTFKPGVNYAAGGPVGAIAAIDLTGNGDAGVLVADSNDNKIFLLAGNGKGTLAAPVDYYPGGSNPVWLTVADFNQDGAPDVVVADGTTQGFMVLYNTGGTFITLTTSNKTPTAGQSVTFTATVAASVAGSGTPTGTIEFKNGSTTIGTASLSSGKATLHYAGLSAGTHSITADYEGSTSFNPHASAAVGETVK